MNKKIFIIVGILVLLVGGFFIYKNFGGYKIKNTPAKGTKIVAFGDSLVEGVGSSKGNDFISLVATKIGKPIINLGKSGDTTKTALLRLNSLLAQKPDVAIVLLGGNDYLHRIPKEETFKNLETIVNKLQANGTAVLLLGVRGGAIRDTYASDYKKFARSHGTGYVSNVLENLLGNKELMYDTIHPNDTGYAIIADRVAPAVEKLFVK